jgi:tryptophan-rich sensory protein
MKSDPLKVEPLLQQAREITRPRSRGGQQVIALAAALALPLLTGALGAVATNRSLTIWYPSLRKPAFNPPSWVFGPVWTALYVLMGIASWLVWQRGASQGVRFGWLRRRSKPVRSALIIYGLQLLANLAWSWLFFGWQRIDLALAGLGVLWCLLMATLVRFWQIRPLAGWLLVPYQLWISFAAVLNPMVWRMNRNGATPYQIDQ